MNVLVVGKGGREHALCWRIARSPSLKKLYCAPGSAGISAVAECLAVGDDDIVRAALEKRIDLVVIGPETPLVDGLADRLRKEGIRVFGPGWDGARLEGSKIFAKNFLRKYGIPTARYVEAHSPREALGAVNELGERVVIKADGLAAGKGVIVCSTKQEAMEAVETLMVKEAMGSAGRNLVVEERLEGQEVSIIALCDGSKTCMLLPTQDHKRVFDNDAGPNTGGMGAYAPARKVSPPPLVKVIEKTVVAPTLEGLHREGIDFRGTLYCGLMITPGGEPSVLEFNVRFGDPETQPQMALLDEDLAALLMSAASGELAKTELRWRPGAAVTVVVAAEGYPGNVTKGDAIDGLDDLDENDDQVVFHAGTDRRDGGWVTDGGRVLGVTATGGDLEEARGRAYALVSRIKWRGMHFRGDIGLKGI
jgi:phosphoribosylamine--glycine ligase